MRNRQVPRERMVPFLREFSRRHDGWLATVRVMQPRLGSQVEAPDLPLEGIVSSCRRHRARSRSTRSRSPDRNLEHRHRRSPARSGSRCRRRDEDQALEIVSEDGTKTILQFRAGQVRHPTGLRLRGGGEVRKILVATDGSRAGVAAVKFAAGLARTDDRDDRLIVLTVELGRGGARRARGPGSRRRCR